MLQLLWMHTLHRSAHNHLRGHSAYYVGWQRYIGHGEEYVMVRPAAPQEQQASSVVSHSLTIAVLKQRLRNRDAITPEVIAEVARQIDDGVPRRQIALYLHETTGLKVAVIARLLDQRYQTVYNTILLAEEHAQELAAKNVQLVTCSVCGRPLHDPKSADLRIGPACSRHVRDNSLPSDQNTT